jgi:aminoglycoside phosphotransferase (APT) family kinase protein
MSALLPKRVEELLRAAFPAAPIADLAPTFGGFSNLTCSLRLGGVAHIIKAASLPAKRADLRREARVLALLAGTGLPIAPLAALLESEELTVEVLGHMPGENGLRRMGDPPAALAHMYAKLGTLLAHVHALALPRLDEPDLSLPARARAVAAALSALALPDELGIPLHQGLARVSAAHAPLRMVHGDPGAHNLLFHGGLSALLDWEWAGLGDPRTDLAWVCWTLRFRELPGLVRAAFLEAYGQPELDRAALRDFVLAQIAAILVRVADLPPARDEWLRRLRWTLALPEI